ncbi:hypothetical protein VE03_03102 [Pseudogymnoascus sp. 23342-1-I1]|nr:hypothetical protein VE03_03102 [Pseudogymnoascus sp. 23342-1-I1]
MNANETTYSANVPNVCQKYINGAINPPNEPSCFTSLYSTISGHNQTFETCCGEAKPEIYGDDKPCFQYCEAGDFAAEKVIYECLKKSDINFGCTGKRDEAGNFSGVGPARSLSVGGVLVVGLALVGMLSV